MCIAVRIDRKIEDVNNNEESELNAKLQITYREKAERGLKIKELESRLNRAEKELEQIKSRKAYSILKKINRI